MKSLSKDAIFYIKYYATKHGCVIERKATIDDVCKQEFTAKGGSDVQDEYYGSAFFLVQDDIIIAFNDIPIFGEIIKSNDFPSLR